MSSQPRDTPPPYPSGWFAAAFPEELPSGKVLTRPFMDREIALFRTRSGIARATEAYCPHLGAHFGHGGRVEGETLRCPFHGFTYGVDGRCAHSPYGSPPPAARLGLLPLREVYGAVMVYHDLPGETPWEIELPADSDADMWRPYRARKLQFRSHPQEVTENSVDLGHLSVLHGFDGVRMVEPLALDGPRLRTSCVIRRPLPLFKGIQAKIRVRVDGLGFSLVELELRGGWALRQLVLTTPIAQRLVDVYVSTSLRRRGDTALAKAMWRPAEALIERGVLLGVIRELRRDQSIWITRNTSIALRLRPETDRSGAIAPGRASSIPKERLDEHGSGSVARDSRRRCSGGVRLLELASAAGPSA